MDEGTQTWTWGSLLRNSHAYIALWNGGLAVNSFIGQPQKVFFDTKTAFPACYVLMAAIVGAFHKHVRILAADFLKEIPMSMFHPWNELKILCF